MTETVAHYMPSTARRVVAVVHGSPWPDGSKSVSEVVDYTWFLVERWRSFADEHDAAILAPPLGSPGFADYRGWRADNGVRPDVYLNEIVTQFVRSGSLASAGDRFSLFGHSAGAQFVARYLVLHASRVTAAVMSAASTFPVPDDSAPWPFGSRGAPQNANWSSACGVSATVCVGANDTEPRPSAPGQPGTTRIDRATAWVAAMRAHAVASGVTPRLNLSIAPGIDHDEIRMSIYGQAELSSLWQAASLSG